jgi:hypothetical protein
MSNGASESLWNSQRLAIAVACLIFLSFMIAFPLTLRSYCSASEINQKPISHAFPTNDVSQSHTASKPTLITHTIASRPKTNESTSWWFRFWCDVNASDYFIALFTLVLAMVTYFLWRETGRLVKGADDQSIKMRESINEASRAATAMEQVASSMATNVESVKTSVQTTREIADRQKLITELQSRAYLAVAFYGMVPQNSATGIRFEPRMVIINNGNTPAYRVKFRTASDVLPMPLRNDFDFPLPDELPSRSLSVIGPRLNKIVSAVVPKIYPDVEVTQIMAGVGQRIVMWGVVTYYDAFGIERFVKFSQSFAWLTDGNILGFDTAHHNDAD